MNQALLIIDVQNDYFEGGRNELSNPVSALDNIVKALSLFREKNLPVIHVQHINVREGAVFFLPDTDGVKIHEKLTPLQNEHLVTKHAPSSYLGTNLATILKEKGITNLVVCGMMSHMCVNTTVRACMDYGIKVTLLADACTTRDLEFDGKVIPAKTVHDVSMASLNGVFADVIKTSDFNL